MKLAASDFPKLQWSLLAATLMTLVGIVTVYLSSGAMQTAARDRTTVLTERNEFDGKLKRVRNEESEIRQKAAVFSALQARGMIGEEQRLEWVELIKEIRDTRRLIDLQYEIAPQRRLDAAADAKTGDGFAFYSSSMKLQVKLLHEEDLTRLLDDLRNRARALIQVKSCNVSRLSPGPVGGSPAAQLQADCQIDWITLRENMDGQTKGQGK
ncbi:MAG: hypothetical protein QM739_02420 [Propionivibrio sp.]